MNRKNYLIAFTKNKRNGKEFDDNYSLFRCYASFLTDYSKNVERLTKQLVKEYCKFKSISISQRIDVDLPNFERCFKINVLLTNVNWEKIYESPYRYSNYLPLLKENEHYILVTDKTRTGNFIVCNNCLGIYKTRDTYKAHKIHGRCHPYQTKLEYPGGGYMAGMGKNLWTLLAAENIGINSVQRHPEFFTVFDFETRLNHIHKAKGMGTILSEELIPTSFAIATNIPNCESIFRIDANPQMLVNEFWFCLTNLSNKAYKLLRPRYKLIFNILNEKCKQFFKDFQKYKMATPNKKKTMYKERRNHKRYCHLKNIEKRLENYIRVLPVLGFNSRSFDLPLIKPYMAKHLDIYCTSVKRATNFISLRTKNFVFLDVIGYLGPGTSLEKFLKTFLADEENQRKGFFPYEWFDSIEKLNTNKFPSREDFFSKLKGESISEEDYEKALKVWYELPEPKTMRAYLEWYNKNDCIPFLKGCEKIRKFWIEHGNISPWRDVVSLPGISYKLARFIRKSRISWSDLVNYFSF